MNLDAAFSKWYASQDHAGLPWQTSRDELFNVFFAGWSAKGEAMKQTDLFPGTWDKDPVSANEGQPAVGSSFTLISPPGSKLMDEVRAAASITAEDIYAAFPRKVGKQAAIKAIHKAIKATRVNARKPFDQKAVTPEWMLNRVQQYASSVAQWPAADKKFIPHPATWFNRGSYDDDPKEWSRGATTSQFSKTH